MSIKHCDHHKDCERERLYRRCCAAIVAIILVVLLIVLIVWLVLRPTRPRFYLNDVAVACFNVTAGASSYSSSYLTVTMQATLAARNPNDRVGIFYDQAVAYAEYKGLQITVPTALPVIYQGHLDTSIWSPFLSGSNVPLPPNLAVSITQGETAGYLLDRDHPGRGLDTVEGRGLHHQPLPPQGQVPRAAHRQRREGKLRLQQRRRRRILQVPARGALHRRCLIQTMHDRVHMTVFTIISVCFHNDHALLLIYILTTRS